MRNNSVAVISALRFILSSFVLPMMHTKSETDMPSVLTGPTSLPQLWQIESPGQHARVQIPGRYRNSRWSDAMLPASSASDAVLRGITDKILQTRGCNLRKSCLHFSLRNEGSRRNTECQTTRQ